MTKKETAAILAVLRAAYPNFYRGFSAEDLTDIVTLWAEMFAADDCRAVAVAVKALIASKADGYPPTIGAVKEKLVCLSHADALDETSAWSLVYKACANGLYGYKTEFEKLPPEVQSAVGSPEQIRTWAMIDEQTLQSVVASNFMRSYRAGKQRRRDEALLPPEVRKMLPEIKNIGVGLPAAGKEKM